MKTATELWELKYMYEKDDPRLILVSMDTQRLRELLLIENPIFTLVHVRALKSPFYSVLKERYWA